MPGGAHENMKGWSPEEDRLLLQLINDKGKRWKLIAEALGAGAQRTPAMVRNRYLRIERGRFLTEMGKSKNRCGQCGQLKRGHVCTAARPVVASSDLALQNARNHEARLSLAAGVPPMSPALSSPGGEHMYGGGGGVRGIGGLTLVPSSNDETMSLASPSMTFSVGGPGVPSPGEGILTLSGLTPNLGPPTLRPQNSMEILAQTAMSIGNMTAEMQKMREIEEAAAEAVAAAAGAPPPGATVRVSSDTSSTSSTASQHDTASQLETEAEECAAPMADAPTAEAPMAVQSELAGASGCVPCDDEEAELVAAERVASRLADGSMGAPLVGETSTKVTPPPTEASLERLFAPESVGTDPGDRHRRGAELAVTPEHSGAF